MPVYLAVSMHCQVCARVWWSWREDGRFDFFDGIFRVPVYGCSNIILLEGICSLALFMPVELFDECARTIDHVGGVVRQLHGCAHVILVA